MLEKKDLILSKIGYGAMGLEGYYGASDDTEAVKTLQFAIEHNMLIDTADAYGAGHNEALIAKALQATSQEAYVATKFGIVFEEGQTGSTLDTGWGFPLTINGTKQYIKRAIDNSLQRLNVDKIDLLYAHYLDPKTALEETIDAMAEAVKEGKVAAIGLSNVTADEILRAEKVHHIAAVQYEYSLFRREAELDIIPAIQQINSNLVCWSPLGAGFLTGSFEKLAEGDFRNNNPKMQGDNMKKNLARLAGFKQLAADLQVTPAQLALAWLLHQGNNIMPIPGSRKVSRIQENLAAQDIKLSKEVLQKINELAPLGAFTGATLV